MTASDQTTVGLDYLLRQTARGDEEAFTRLYDLSVPRVHGLVLRVVRNPAHAEEVTQEIFLEAWRTSSRFDSSKGSALSWLLTMAHRRAVDRVRSTQAASNRDHAVGAKSLDREYDEVAEEAANSMERQSLSRCLTLLTALQREAITLAYYQGYTYREVAELLRAAVPTVKTRMRDGLIKLRDCMGVAQ
ncbi:MAG: ECF RNA polymerase sigma factor SigK [Corynebacteriales bacterium]|nr:ECF RNA polymerase sigma factor SigK [Mycobacteriales bacterium]